MQLKIFHNTVAAALSMEETVLRTGCGLDLMCSSMVDE